MCRDHGRQTGESRCAISAGFKTIAIGQAVERRIVAVVKSIAMLKDYRFGSTQQIEAIIAVEP